METAYLLSSKKNADRLFESIQQIRDGVGVSIELADMSDISLMFTNFEVKICDLKLVRPQTHTIFNSHFKHAITQQTIAIAQRIALLIKSK